MPKFEVTYSPYVWNKREYGEERTIVGSQEDVAEVFLYALRGVNEHKISKIVIDGAEVPVDSFLETLDTTSRESDISAIRKWINS